MKTVIYGNGAMAKVVFSYARRVMDIAGFTVDDACVHEAQADFLGLPLVPLSRVEKEYPPDTHDIIVAVSFIDMNGLRARKSQELERKRYRFASYVHESVQMHDDVLIEENCVVLDHVSIHPGSRIARGTFVSSNVNIGHDCIVGAYNWINSGVAIGGGCTIGDGCFFGVNASAAHGLRIGAHNFIAANTLVNKHTEEHQVYVSEPGQLFRLKSRSFLKFGKVLG
jgi:sugar O-acyltransferase (sialic acid O-acetyltransferase NeuD family)